MPYTDVISINDAKTYLGVDGSGRDGEISRIIDSALRFVEDHSSHVLVARNKRYVYRGNCVKVYDYPINSVTAPNPDTTTITELPSYHLVEDSDTNNTSVTLNVGYESVVDIPPALVEAGYVAIEHLFSENGSKGSLPATFWDLVHSVKRHIL